MFNCANRGTPTGGEKDTDPPVILKESPSNYSTNFKGNEIKIYFDEYVKINDLRKQLIISPPMNNAPDISPLGTASREIIIRIKDTLAENTTYAFNFGESIVDNNEGNPYPYYRYVFSTGNTIDSLSVKGYVEDALLEKPDTFISVMLYEVDSTYTDSIVYKEKPRYITNTLDSITNFSIDNIKAGTYRLLALKDKNSNYNFDPKADKIGFIDKEITVPTNEEYRIRLFKEELEFKSYKPKHISEQKIAFPYEGDYKNMKIKVLENKPDSLSYRLIKDKDKDTLYYWFKPKFEIDTTRFLVTNLKHSDTFKLKFRSKEKDSLTLKAYSKSTLDFGDDFILEASTPLKSIDTSLINFITKDSLKVAYNVEYDSLYNRYKFPFKKEENQKYKVQMLPGTFTDFFNESNKDTLNYNISTRKKSFYGNVRVILSNAKYPLIVQLVDNKGEVKYEQYTTSSNTVDFNDVVPKKYSLRVVFDTNKNGKYDTGNLLLGIQPERVSYSSPIEEVRASFDFIIDFPLLD